MSRERRYEAWNELCDSDALWGPLLGLRPARDSAFSPARLLVLTSLFGVFYGGCLDLILGWIHHLLYRFPSVPLYFFPVFLTATAFACGELTFVRAWNARAHRMTRRSRWIDENSRVA